MSYDLVETSQTQSNMLKVLHAMLWHASNDCIANTSTSYISVMSQGLQRGRKCSTKRETFPTYPSTIENTSHSVQRSAIHSFLGFSLPVKNVFQNLGQHRDKVIRNP